MKPLNLLKLAILVYFSSSNLIYSQIAYSNLEPDSIFKTSYGGPVDGSNYLNLDINGDAINDVAIIIHYSYGDQSASVQPLNNTAIIYDAGYADTLNIFDTISAFSNWSTEQLSLTYLNTYNSQLAGKWADVNNKFLGVRFVDGSNVFYGWVRLEVKGPNIEITVKDFAYNTQPNQPIIAGEGILPIAENINISDIANNKNGSDIRVDFEKAIDEQTVNEYRIIAVKESESNSFNIDSALLVTQNNYFSIIPNGTNFSDTMPSDFKDKNGMLIQEFIPYKIFVLSICDGNLNLLSMPSNSLILSSPANAASNVNVTEAYIGDFNYFIDVSFDKIIDEASISEYRVYFVKSSNSNSFNIDSALLSTSGSYYSIFPTGNNLSKSFRSDTLMDISANLIAHENDYKVFVLSLADGIHSNVSALSLPSNIIVLSEPVTAVRGVLVEDITDFGNANDIQLSFNKILDESNIYAYRAIAVKLENADTFDLTRANTVVNDNSLPVNCTGDNISLTLPDDMLDNEGNIIEYGIPYRFYILTLADTLHTDINALSYPSNIVSISNPNFFKAGLTSGQGIDYFDFNPDSVLYVDFHNSDVDFNLDINNDLVSDFSIQISMSASPSHNSGYYGIKTLGGNAVCILSNINRNPDTLSVGKMIGPHLYWGNGTFTLYSYSNVYVPPFTNTHSGIWLGATDKYIGLKVLTLQDTLYGWLRLDLNGSIVLKDFAYQRSTTDIENLNKEKSIEIYPNPVSETLFIDSQINSTVSVYSILGQEVITKKINIGINNIDISEITSGIYMLKYKVGNCFLFDKIVIQ